MQTNTIYKIEPIEHLYYCLKRSISFIFTAMRLITILFFFCIYIQAAAQMPIQRMYVKKLNTNNGLAQSTVQSTIIDGNGMMWIGTSAGVQWYDGYNFYKIKGKGSEPLQTTSFVQLLKDSTENIWAVYNKGVIKYDIKTGRFSSILEFDKSILCTGNNVHVLNTSESNFIVMFVNKFGLFSINKKTNSIARNKILIPDIANSTGANIYTIADKEDYCYAQTNPIDGGGVYQIKIADLSVKKIYNFQLDYSAVQIINDSLIIARNKSTYFTYNFITNKTYQNENSINILLNNIAKKEKSSQAIFYDSGLFKIYDTKQNKFTGIVADVNNNTKVTNFAPFYAIQKDSYNNYWVGTSGDGLIQINTNALKFNSVLDYEKADNNYLRSILWDEEEQYLFAALRGEGFNMYDKNGRVVKRCSDMQGANLVTQNENSVMQILKIAKGKYVMTNQQYPFITLLDLNTNKILDITYLLKNKYKKNEPINFYCSATSINKTTHYCMVKTEVYKIFYKNNEPQMQLVFDLKNVVGGLFYDDNKILVGSNGKFLQIDTVGNIVQTIKIDGDENTLVKYFEKDAKNNIWIATNNGLFVWDKKNSPIQIKNIPDHFFYTLAQEKNSNYIWCSSNTGLYRLNINDKHFTQYTVNDGLLNNEFNTNSCAKISDGTIYFGTAKGINSIDPTKLIAYAQAPTPTIINISTGSFNVGMDTAINQLSSVSFSHKENDVSINFASIDFSSEDENVYRYRFVNKDTVWKEIGKTRSLNFVLEPGKYLFQVQAGKQLNSYNPIYKQIEIIITPPFYKTWWFIGLMSLLILSGVFALGFAIKNYIDRKKIAALKMQMQLQKERERISKDLHDNIGAQATALFYGIEGLEENDKTEKMVSLKQTTLDMMDGLRETIWALGKGEVSVTALSDRFKLFMKKIGKHYPHIKFVVQEDIETDAILTAEQGLHVLRILQEALNNALKHAEAKNIYFVIESNKKISIQIKDDGKGIDGTTASNFSDGNGMINMKERAAVAGFEFRLKSEEGRGTVVFLIQ
jgi:signal transduction histidine kinase